MRHAGRLPLSRPATSITPIWAKPLGRTEIAGILQQTLDEEYATDDPLTKMAMSKASAKAEAVSEPA